MRQLNVAVLVRHERAVLRSLGQLGAVQLIRARAGPDTAPLPPPDYREELAGCERLLTRVKAVRGSLESALPMGQLVEATELTLHQAAEKMDLMEIRASELLQRRQRRLQRWSELIASLDRVSGYQGLDLPLDPFDHYSFLHFVTGTLPTENLAKLQTQVGDKVALLPLSAQAARQPLIAMTTRQNRLVLERALQQVGFQPELLPAVEGATVDTLSERSQRERTAVAAELKQLNEESHALAVEFAPVLAQIEQRASLERHLLEAEHHFPRTESAVLISGWVPADDTSALERRVREITGGRCAIETSLPDRLDNKQIPVLLRHPRWLRPFELLVTSYGLPNYCELEPTLFVALSYVLMFGMMFGDAGHGALLATGGLLALFAGRTAKLRDVGLLLLFGGLSSMTFGFVYGSCFGLAQFKQYALWHDPLEGDPMHLMYGAIGIGIVLISLGLILNIINRFRRGDLLGGFLDKFGVVGAVFYWGALALITKYAAIQSRGLVSLAVILFLVLPLLGWMLKEPIEYFLSRRAGHPVEPGRGLFAAITESLVGAFEGVLSYLANTISFVRLAAYAMSHAALLVAAFMMAAEVKHFSIGGTALSVLVVILGNLVAIVLEGIIASVQALRLEYYEFFGKFFSGNGQAFTPFRLTAIRT